MNKVFWWHHDYFALFRDLKLINSRGFGNHIAMNRVVRLKYSPLFGLALIFVVPLEQKYQLEKNVGRFCVVCNMQKHQISVFGVSILRYIFNQCSFYACYQTSITRGFFDIFRIVAPISTRLLRNIPKCCSNSSGS